MPVGADVVIDEEPLEELRSRAPVDPQILRQHARRVLTASVRRVPGTPAVHGPPLHLEHNTLSVRAAQKLFVFCCFFFLTHAVRRHRRKKTRESNGVDE